MSIPKEFWEEHDILKREYHEKVACAYLKVRGKIVKATDEISRQQIIDDNNKKIAILTQQHKSEMRNLCKKFGFNMDDYFKE